MKRKDYDELEKIASDIIMGDIKALHAAKAAGASVAVSKENAPQAPSISLLEGKVKELATQAEEGDPKAKRKLKKLRPVVEANGRKKMMSPWLQDAVAKTWRRVANSPPRPSETRRGKAELIARSPMVRTSKTPVTGAHRTPAVANTSRAKAYIRDVLPTKTPQTTTGQQQQKKLKVEQKSTTKTLTITRNRQGHATKITKKSGSSVRPQPSRQFPEKRDVSLPRSVSNTLSKKELNARDSVRAARILAKG